MQITRRSNESGAKALQPDPKFRIFMEAAPDAIVVVDQTGKIAMVNHLAERIIGSSRDEMLGQTIEMLVPERYRQAHVRHRDGYFQHPKTRPMGEGRPLSGRRKDGSEFPVEISLSPLESEESHFVISIIRDITERRLAEERLQESLREKEALLREIHHRVKNNLQVTSSLISLQSDSIQDEHARGVFMESQNRIRSMALVHEKLYRSSNLSQIRLAEYVESLAQLLLRSYGIGVNRVSVKVEGEPVSLSVETAVPCGLLVNELLSNCLKHAFPGDRKGRITVRIGRSSPSQVILEVIDDGVGLPAQFSLEKPETLGLQLVSALVRQLSGRVEARNEGGARFRVIFSDGHSEGKGGGT